VPKVHLSYSSPALQRRCRGFARALAFVLGEELKSLRAHPRYAQWRTWNGARPASLGLFICSDQEIRTYNRDYRKMDKATDVLSFPAHEASPEPAPGMAGYLGDLIISLETVERAATRVRRPLTDEFVEVFVHGVLHLLGFDHLVGKGVSRSDAKEMKSLQAELFKKLRAPIKKRYGSFVQKP